MTHEYDESGLEATEEQLDALREYGYLDQQIAGLSMAEAAALIDEAQSERDAARKTGRPAGYGR